MLIVNIKGGLGNQMFQYAFAYIRAKKLNRNLFVLDSTKFATVPREYCLNVFDVKPSIKNRAFLRFAHIVVSGLAVLHRRVKFLNKFYLQDLDDEEAENAFADRVIILNGYWQRANYYVDNINEVRKLFTFPAVPIQHKIIDFKPGKKYIAMHIRRGDYVPQSGVDSIHSVCDIDWYKRSLHHMVAKVGEAKVIIFTDDEKWVKANFTSQDHDIFIVPNDSARDSWVDLYYMSLCDHFIISNSSFSWWSAFIGQKSGSIVVAPKYWFKGVKTQTLSICPKSWELV